MFCKKGVLENFIKNFIKKENLAHVFSCEFCEIFKNSFFHRTPPVAASVITVIITDEVVLTKLKRPTLTRILQFYNLTTLLDLGPFVQLKKREKYPWMSVTLLKVTLLHEYFHIFHLCKWYQIAQSITNESGDTNLSMLNQDGDQTLTDDDHGQK